MAKKTKSDEERLDAAERRAKKAIGEALKAYVRAAGRYGHKCDVKSAGKTLGLSQDGAVDALALC